MLAAKRSGQSAREWGRANGIDGRSLHAWTVNLNRCEGAKVQSVRHAPTGSTAKRGLVELVAHGGVPTRKTARYVLEIGGARLEFDDDVSVVTLRRVLEALGSC